MKLMVVEDEEAIRELVVQTLQSAGHEVITAVDGLDALDVLAHTAPDAILLDINMPRMNGLELLGRLAKDRARREIPVIMLTALSSSDDIRKAIQLGARDYIGKPFQVRQLLRRIDRLAA